MPQQNIIDAIHSLVREGKAISTAAVKARVSGPVNMVQLLQLVSRYKQSPGSLPSAEPINAVDEPQHDASLAAKVAELEARVARLEALLTSSTALKEEQHD
ncbi:hypothetical protein [uncultured Oceanisphaera sp.]|uniref:hypothetical protein n=1 Tax=uncultured Oceanisphaera sp. TaxID=353858 RepID=UPI002636586B|nr:hypothetical protein [uncultured Oceanisphaera sp.]